MDKRCPKCRLYNPPSAQRCDCGYDFESEALEKPYGLPSKSARRVTGRRWILVVVSVLLASVFAVALKSAFVTAIAGPTHPSSTNLPHATSSAPPVNSGSRPVVSDTPTANIQVLVSSQDAEGLTQSLMNLDFLKMLEDHTVERVKANAKKYLASKGISNSAVDVRSESTYVQSGATKLAVIRLYGSDQSRHVFISGLVGSEFRRVACLRSTPEAIPLFYGPCGDKIKEVFGVAIDH